jgi:hypothetical protein
LEGRDRRLAEVACWIALVIGILEPIEDHVAEDAVCPRYDIDSMSPARAFEAEPARTGLPR